MAKFKVGDKVKAIPAIAAVSAPKMKGRVWTVTAVVAGGRRVDLESNGEKLSGIMETALTAANSAVANAAYSDALKIIMDSVKGYMDRRIKGDDAWKYPNFVITILRKVCDTATMSAGRYDGKRPPHRIYNVECTLRGYKFQGSLICTGLLHRDDPDDVSAFDEYDMTLSLMNVGKVSISRNPVVANALAWRKDSVVVANTPMEYATQVYSQGVGARVMPPPNPSWEIKLGCRGDCLVFYSDKSMDPCIKAAKEHIAYMDEIKRNLLKAIEWMKKHG